MATQTAIDLETLTRVAGHTDTACRQSKAAQVFIKRGDGSQAAQSIEGAGANTSLALALLAAHGVVPAKYQRQEAGSLAELANLNTPEARALLTAIEVLIPLAEKVDEQRGRSVPADIPRGPSEPRGTDLAESLALLRLRLHAEIEGPRGRE